MRDNVARQALWVICHYNITDYKHVLWKCFYTRRKLVLYYNFTTFQPSLFEKYLSLQYYRLQARYWKYIYAKSKGVQHYNFKTNFFRYLSIQHYRHVLGKCFYARSKGVQNYNFTTLQPNLFEKYYLLYRYNITRLQPLQARLGKYIYVKYIFIYLYVTKK